MRPERSALLQNFLNPFNPDTWIPYQLKEGGDVKIWIYNVSGELVRILELGISLLVYIQVVMGQHIGMAEMNQARRLPVEYISTEFRQMVSRQ